MDLSTDGLLIIRTLAYALRHNPAQFILKLDDEGWTKIERLVEELRYARYDWAFLDWTRVERTIKGSDRFELRNGMIRAAYGHSIRLGNPPGIATPPDVLLHGTDAGNVAAISKAGLSPRNRHFVHLSSDRAWINVFVTSKPEWAIFQVNAKFAHADGVRFRKANHHVWLADHIDPQYLFLESRSSVGASRPPVAVAGHEAPPSEAANYPGDR